MRYIIFVLVATFFFSQLTAQCFEPDATIWQNTWASCTPSPNPKTEYGNSHWILYDLGKAQKLSKTWIWNTNDPSELDRGFKDVKIDYSLDGENWTFWGDMIFPQGSGTAIYGGFPGPDMIGIRARYILITVLNNFGDPNCYGLAEVKFNLLPNAIGSSPDGTYEDCQAVSEAEVEITGSTQATISWEPIEDIENYLVEYRLVGTEDWQQALDNYLEAILYDLIPLETYEYRISSLCFSELSEPVTGTFTLSEDAFCPPAEEVEIFLSEVGATEAFLYWPFYDFTPGNMTVTIYPEGAPSDQWVTVEVFEPEIFFADLLPATDYIMMVSWTCADQVFTTDDFYFTTRNEGTGYCNAVGDINLESIELTTATFSWEPVPNAESYVVIYSLEGEEDWNTIQTDQPNITLTDLLPQEPYVLVIGILCGENELWSPPYFFETDPTLSTNETLSGQRSITTLPNPTRGPLAIEYTSNKKEAISYQLINTMGQILESGQWVHLGGKQQYDLDISSRINGMYFLRLNVDGLLPLPAQRIVKIN
ncbi:MAG: fibronectin type III domain-containing protein [Bacteroidota bacterium]